MNIDAPSAAPTSAHARFVRLLGYVAWSYALVVIASCVFMYAGGDRWWPATMLLFSPRWLIALPLAMLVPLALWLNRRLLLPLLLSALVIFGPFMGLRFPIEKPKPGTGPLFRVLTCNIHGGGASEEALLSLVEEVRADLVALQECPPEMRNKMPGWFVLQEGGLALMSRRPFLSQGAVRTVRVPYRWPAVSMLHGTVGMPGGAVTLCNIHLPTPRFGLQNLLDRRTVLDPAKSGELVNETWYRESNARTLREALDALPGPVVVAGDFNTPVESRIYRTVWGDLTNAFDRVGKGYGHSQRATLRGYRYGVRIDHVLTGKGLVPQVCEVGPDVGSDHLPVIADVGFGG